MPPAPELLIAANPDPESRLEYLLRVPIGEGLILRTSATWPRTKALFCYPVPTDEWPTVPDIVERIPLRSCVRRGAAIDLVAARARENRSQLVFTTARGRDAVFWQSPRTRKQARPSVSLPSARAAGMAELEIVVDVYERYAYKFAGKPVRTVSRALPCGDYGVLVDGTLAAAVERKTLPDLITSLTSGRLRYALGELAALPRAAVVVEDRYSQVFKQDRVRPALVADGLAECQARWPNVTIGFYETRGLAEEWTYRYLAAALAWAVAEPAAIERIATPAPPSARVAGRASRHAPHALYAPHAPRRAGSEDVTASAATTPAAMRAWARANGIDVPDRGRMPATVRAAWEAWRAAPGGSTDSGPSS